MEIKRIDIPRWMKDEMRPHRAGPATRIECRRGETATIVWRNGTRSTVPVPTDGHVYGPKADSRRQDAAVIMTNGQGYLVAVTARHTRLPRWIPRWMVENAVRKIEIPEREGRAGS